MEESIEQLFKMVKGVQDSEAEYLCAKRVLKEEKARIGQETKWELEFPNKSRVTVDDKKDFITIAVSDLQKDCDVAEAKYHHAKELWELEKILLKIKSSSNIELNRLGADIQGVGLQIEMLREDIRDKG